MDPYVLKRLWRRPWLSLCSLVLSGVLCFLLCFLSGYQQEQERELTQAQESFDILCVVSNVTGTQTTGLRLGPWASYFVTSEEFELHEHIKDLRMVKEYEILCPALGISDAHLFGVTNERCADALDIDMGGGIREVEAGFFDSQEYICLVSEEKYLELGDEKTITVSVTDPYINRQETPEKGFGQIEFRVAGFYAGKGSDLYMPFPASEKLSQELSDKITVDAIAFLAADNLALEALSAAASEQFQTVDPMAADTSRITAALTIHDEQYRATVAALEQNIQRTGYLLPLVAVLGLGVGFLISFLATRGERRTYALMRTLGMTRGKLLGSILREQLALPMLAAAVIALATEGYAPAAFYLLCHTTGCCIAVIRSVRTAPTAILREQE